MGRLSELETAVLEAATSGEDQVCRALRNQIAHTSVGGRQLTGVGFYADLNVEPSTSPAPDLRDFSIADVEAQVDGLEFRAGFIVFVRNGYLALLEGVVNEGSWPENPKGFRVEVQEPRLPRVVAPSDLNSAG